jgi:hypothetical protein
MIKAMTGIFVRIGPYVDYTIQLYNRHTCQNLAFLGAFDLLGLNFVSCDIGSFRDGSG